MKRTSNLIYSIAGVIGIGVGITIAVPGFLKERYIMAVLATMLMVAGLVLLAIAFGEDE